MLLVVDAAYAEYVDLPDYESGLDMVKAHDNVVMTRTFSKIFGLAALRLGWAYCPPAVADVLNRIRGPFNVPAPAQAAGVTALADREHLRRRPRRTTTAGCPGSRSACARSACIPIPASPTSCW